MTYVSVKHDEIDTIDTMQGRESVVSYTPRPIWQSFVDWCASISAKACIQNWEPVLGVRTC